MTRQAGKRRHRASVAQHNGNQDGHGNPTYSVAQDWNEDIITDYPVELLTVRGGEQLRGGQVTGETTHVMYGEFWGGQEIAPDMRVTIEGVTYSVISSFDPEGTGREKRTDLKRQV